MLDELYDEISNLDIGETGYLYLTHAEYRAWFALTDYLRENLAVSLEQQIALNSLCSIERRK